MAVADDLEQARAALRMINPAPYNAEAPPEALAGDITPTELHYVRSNFAVPDARRHARDRRRRRATRPPSRSTTCAPCRHRAGGHARMRGQRAARDATAADRRAVGRLRGLDRPLDRRPPARGAGAGAAGSRRRRGPVRGRRPRRLPPQAGPCGDRQGRPDLRARPAPRPRGRPGGGDPHRLRDERRAAGPRPRSPLPDHRAPLVRRRLREVAQADRRPDRAVRRRVPDRPLHVRVARPAARARQPHARAGAHHRPRSGRRSARGTHTVRGKAWSGTGPVTRVDVSLTGEGDWHPAAARAAQGPVPVAGLVVRLGRRPTSAGTPSAPGRPTPPATSNRRSRPGTASATETTPSRSSTSTWSRQGRPRDHRRHRAHPGGTTTRRPSARWR